MEGGFAEARQIYSLILWPLGNPSERRHIVLMATCLVNRFLIKLLTHDRLPRGLAVAGPAALMEHRRGRFGTTVEVAICSQASARWLVASIVVATKRSNWRCDSPRRNANYPPPRAVAGLVNHVEEYLQVG